MRVIEVSVLINDRKTLTLKRIKYDIKDRLKIGRLKEEISRITGLQADHLQLTMTS